MCYSFVSILRTSVWTCSPVSHVFKRKIWSSKSIFTATGHPPDLKRYKEPCDQPGHVKFILYVSVHAFEVPGLLRNSHVYDAYVRQWRTKRNLDDVYIRQWHTKWIFFGTQKELNLTYIYVIGLQKNTSVACKGLIQH